jgi:hypothetical protein
MEVKIRDLDERYTFVSDSQDRLAVLESLDLEEEASEWPYLFVWAENGEILEVWGCCFPWLDAPAVPLFPPHTLTYTDEGDS